MNPVADTNMPSGDKVQTHAAPGFYPQPGQLLLVGGVLGLLSIYLIEAGPGGGGPGFTVWLALLAGCSLWLARAGGIARMRTLAIWSASAVGAAVILLFRDLELLIPAMWLVILGSATLTSLHTSGVSLRAARLTDLVLAGFTLPLNVLSLAPRLFGQIDLNTYTHNPRLTGILRGVLLALPLLVIFIALFSAADAAFSRYALTLTDLFSPDTLPNLLKALAFGWIAASLLALACRKSQAAALPDAKPLKLGTVEATVILGLVTALFVLFVLLQLGYLFGGSDTIERTSGLTLAEYARRGFFELLVVGALTLALLLGLGATDCDRRILRRFGTALVVCVLIILVSAAQRLLLYTNAFGLTIDRFSALAVVLWQAFNLVSFAATVLRGRIEGFVSGLAISGIISLLLLGAVNPAAMVAKINLERAVDTGATLDVDYLLGLRADVVPVVLDHFDELPAQEQCTVARHVLSRYLPDATGAENNDWRHWNAARAAALNAVVTRSDQLRGLNC